MEGIEADRKSAKEFEIKYKKLESMFSLEKEKLSQERMKSKSEIALLKKKSEDTLIDLGNTAELFSSKSRWNN